MSATSGAAYRLADFDFELPAELVAQVPAASRSASRLLVVHGARDEALPREQVATPGVPCSGDGRFADLGFSDLPGQLSRGDLVVFNDTRVIRARLFGRKASGGRVEMLVERVTGPDEAWVQLRASHLPAPGSRLEAAGASVAVLAREGRFFHLRFAIDEPLVDWLERHGEIPLPPYIARAGGHAADADAARYQTVYAREPGAVAAPTAGLHFDDATFAALDAAGVERAFVTLHVGAGTFLPVVHDDLALHRMHFERYRIPDATARAIAAARARGSAIVAVGTTTLRTLEGAAARAGGDVPAGDGETDLFITPGYRFHVADRLVTNFHLPRSTLLMLVSAFAGYEAIRAAYAHAIAARYRFYSYGDAMLLTRAAN